MFSLFSTLDAERLVFAIFFVPERSRSNFITNTVRIGFGIRSHAAWVRGEAVNSSITSRLAEQREEMTCRRMERTRRVGAPKSSDSSQGSPSQAAYSYGGLQEDLIRINEPDDQRVVIRPKARFHCLGF